MDVAPLERAPTPTATAGRCVPTPRCFAAAAAFSSTPTRTAADATRHAPPRRPAWAAPAEAQTLAAKLERVYAAAAYAFRSTPARTAAAAASHVVAERAPMACATVHPEASVAGRRAPAFRLTPANTAAAAASHAMAEHAPTECATVQPKPRAAAANALRPTLTNTAAAATRARAAKLAPKADVGSHLVNLELCVAKAPLAFPPTAKITAAVALHALADRLV